MPQTTEQATSTLTDFQKYEAEVARGEQPQIEGEKPKEPSGDAQKVSEKTAPDSETGEKPAAKEESEETSKRGIEKRIAKLTREKREAAEEAERLRKENESLRSAKPGDAPRTAADASATDAPKEPDFNDFATFADYQKAMAKYVKDLTAFEVRQTLKADAEAKAKAETEKAQREAAETWEARLEVARGEHDDFDAVVKKLPITQVMFAMMYESEHGAELLYHLGQNHAEAERIAKLTPGGQSRAITRLEDKLFPDTAEPAKPAAAAKTLPPPPKSIKGISADVDAEPDPSKFVEWSRWADRRDRQKRKDQGLE